MPPTRRPRRTAKPTTPEPAQAPETAKEPYTRDPAKGALVRHIIPVLTNKDRDKTIRLGVYPKRDHPGEKSCTLGIGSSDSSEFAQVSVIITAETYEALSDALQACAEEMEW